jgi:Protein of unknown function (DUF2442)
MQPRIKDVKPDTDYTIILTFDNDEKRRFDVKPYLDIGIFKDIRNKDIFNSVRPFLGSIQWNGGQDFCPDMLYEESKPV